MYDIEKNQVTFPHIISGAVLGNKLHTYNSINGGIKLIEDEPFNLIRNKFFGGITQKLGLIAEYGFHACVHYEKPGIIVGFYIHEPATVTELGKKLIQEKYPDATIIYEKQDIVKKTELTPEEKKKKERLLIKAAEMNIPAYQVGNESVDELESMMDALSSGKSGKKATVSPEQNYIDDVPVLVKHGAKVS